MYKARTKKKKIGKQSINKKAEKYIIITLPKYSKVLKIMKRKQFDEGLVKEYGSVILEDGTIIRNNKSYKLKETEEIKNLIKRGALIAGGSGRRVANG